MGSLLRRAYLGKYWDYHVTLPGTTQILRVTARPQEAFQEGEPAWIKIASAQLTVIGRSGATTSQTAPMQPKANTKMTLLLGGVITLDLTNARHLSDGDMAPVEQCLIGLNDLVDSREFGFRTYVDSLLQ